MHIIVEDISLISSGLPDGRCLHLDGLQLCQVHCEKHAQRCWKRLHPRDCACALQLVYDETGRVWIMLHSGSRNIGNKTAQHYDDVAAKELKRQGITVSQRLHYMEVDSEEGQSYLQVLVPVLTKR